MRETTLMVTFDSTCSGLRDGESVLRGVSLPLLILTLRQLGSTLDLACMTALSKLTTGTYGYVISGSHASEEFLC